MHEEKQKESIRPDHVLVCLSSSPSNERIIRAAAHMANSFGGRFTALYVETGKPRTDNETNRKRLEQNINYAKNCGATIERALGEDVAYVIADYARINGVTDIVIGNNFSSHWIFAPKSSICDRLIEYAVGVEIHIIPDANLVKQNQISRISEEEKSRFFSLTDILKCICCIISATLLGLVFETFGIRTDNIIMLYILSVLVCATITGHQSYSIVLSAISVIVFNFFFISPKFTLFAYDKEYPVTFLIMFIAAVLTGSLAAKQKQNAKEASKLAFRTKVLFDTNQLIGKAKTKDEIIKIALVQLEKLLGRDTLWINNKADEKTDEYLYYPVETSNGYYGEIGISKEGYELTSMASTILTSIVGETALAIENDLILKEKEAAAILAENEKLRANLLRGISHDLRTPLTSISGNATILMDQRDVLDEETKQKIYKDIYDDSVWLMQLVENILSITRIEDGHMKMNMTAELVEDVILEAVSHVKPRTGNREIRVVCKDDLLFAYMDARLIVQMIVNILNNAIKYTPEDAKIEISIGKTIDKKYVKIQVEDDGPGISAEDLPHVFEMFYAGGHIPTDSRQSLGLGLYLCRSIVLAHGGQIEAFNKAPHGAVFSITLKYCDLKQMQLDQDLESDSLLIN